MEIIENKEQIIQMLKRLFTVCRTSEISYRTASNAVESKTIQKLLKSYAEQRGEFAEELRSEIRFHTDTDFNVVPPADAWVQIREAIRSGDEDEIVHECAKSEEVILRVYRNALAAPIPWDVETVLSHQYADIKQACYFVNALELFSSQFVA